MDRFFGAKHVLGWVFVVFFFLAVPHANAAAPKLRLLGKIRAVSSLTTGIGVDNAGNLFVSKARLKTIAKFDRYGSELQSFTPLPAGEGGIAVTPLGDVIYVAAGRSVLQVAGDTGVVAGQLGSAEREFEWVSAIARGSDGSVYVADSGARKVRSYDSHGVFQSEFGGPGEGPGQIGLLSALAVNQVTGEVWVADNLAKGENPGPKVLLFDQDGQFLREMYGRTDFGDQPVGRFGAITFDQSGRVYLLDLQKNEIRCLDLQTMDMAIYKKPGALSSKLFGKADLVFAPLTNRLFVSSGQDVSIFGIDGVQRPVPLITQ